MRVDSTLAMTPAISRNPPCPESSTDLLDKIGNTPLLKFRRIAAHLPGIEIYGKAEYFNPGGSVKDRPALNMILDGERSGRLTPDRVILDATSGNTGIAYAMIAAAKGYRVKLCLPMNASRERKQMLRAYGVDVVMTDPGEGTDGAIRRCQEIYAQDPERYFYPDQYSNPANWEAHFETTAVELLEQTGGRITHLVAGLGTSGTFMGVGRRFRRDAPRVKLISMQPSTGFHGLEGLKHMPTALVPAIYDSTLADENIWLDTEYAYEMCRRLAREEGILAGISSGGNAAAALRVAEQMAARGEQGVIVTILADSAAKYLTEDFWND